MSRVEFSSLLENVVGLCSTPDQRRRAEEAKAEYFASTRVCVRERRALPSRPIKTVRSREALPTRYHHDPLKLGVRERRYRRVTVPPH